MKKLILTLSLFAFLGNMYSQPWMQNIPENKRNSTDINFYTYQKAFNEYWKEHKYERSSGIKPFRRWEEFICRRR